MKNKPEINIGDIVVSLGGGYYKWKLARVIGTHDLWSDVLILEDFYSGVRILELKSKMKKENGGA